MEPNDLNKSSMYLCPVPFFYPAPLQKLEGSFRMVSKLKYFVTGIER